MLRGNGKMFSEKLWQGGKRGKVKRKRKLKRKGDGVKGKGCKGINNGFEKLEYFFFCEGEKIQKGWVIISGGDQTKGVIKC